MRAQLTDTTLMKQIQAGRRIAYGELYERFASRAFRTALSICHDRDCAQDAVQDAFLSIWTSSATYQSSRGPVAGWAMSIVRHRAIYLAHRRAAIDEHPASLADLLDTQSAQDDLPGDLAIRTKHHELTELLRRLPAAQQEVIRLGFFDGLTHQQIARQLALPPGTVKGRIRLGLNKLRSDLDR